MNGGAVTTLSSMRPGGTGQMIQRPIVGAHGNPQSSPGQAAVAVTSTARSQPYNLPMAGRVAPPTGVSAAAAANAVAANALLMQRMVHPRGTSAFFLCFFYRSRTKQVHPLILFGHQNFSI